MTFKNPHQTRPVRCRCRIVFQPALDGWTTEGLHLVDMKPIRIAALVLAATLTASAEARRPGSIP
jgi:hypothetical protein